MLTIEQPKKYRKKPIIIESIQWKGFNTESVHKFCSSIECQREDLEDIHLIVPTLEGNMRVNYCDYIIKGVNGEFYPCKPDIFEKTYDIVD